MTIAYFHNYVSHHVIPLADEIFRLNCGEFYFIEICNTEWITASMSGYSNINRPYIIRAYESKENELFAQKLARESDVMIYGTTASNPYVRIRFEDGTAKLTFEESERWLKRGLLNILSPRLIANKWIYHTTCNKSNLFMLAQGAYVAHDERLLYSYKGKCLKWAYFPKVDIVNANKILCDKRGTSTIRILWIARFLWWKHPEDMISLASELRNKKINFVIDMVGKGPKLKWIQSLVDKNNLHDYINLIGTMPNEELINKIRNYHIFCFTSDRNEGWGAVLNEVMANGCLAIANKEIGSAPFLIEDKKNGFLYERNKKNNLVDKVVYAINHEAERENMCINAYETIKNVWSPQNAAKRLLDFCAEFLRTGNRLEFTDGPMSKA